MITQREQDVCRLLLEGCSNPEIAGKLHIAKRTVKARFYKLFIKYGIEGGHKRVKLAVLLCRRLMSEECAVPLPLTSSGNTNPFGKEEI
jgi:DNA-binding NarL/FixJ family response regulator